MPWNPKDYSPRWKEIRARILKRAGHRCEECGVREYAIGRRKDGVFIPERGNIYWDDYQYTVNYAEAREAADHVNEMREGGEAKAIVIVLTIAHTCHDPKCEDESHLSALCQKCHLTMDAAHHARNAAATRLRKKHLGQKELF